MQWNFDGPNHLITRDDLEGATGGEAMAEVDANPISLFRAQQDSRLDGAIEARVKNTDGVGPLTSAALSATFARKVELNAVSDGGLSTGGTGAANYAAMVYFFNTTIANQVNGGAFVKVIIPPGEYLMSQGLQVLLPQGKGGLHVSGYGARLIFDAAPTTSYAMFRVRPNGGYTVGTAPTGDTFFIRDIYVEGLGIYDPDAIAHANTEETHGISIGYAKNVHVWNCKIEGTGDEPIEFDYVRGGTIHDNFLFNCKATAGATPDGANISVKNGCRDLKVYGNTIDTSVGAGAKGIQIKIIEAATVEDIEIFGNTIRNVTDAGLFINSTGAQARRVRFHHNIIDGNNTAGIKTTTSGIANTGSNPLQECVWEANRVRNIVGDGMNLQPVAGSYSNRCDGNMVNECGASGTATTKYGAFISQLNEGAWASVHGNSFRNIQGRALYLWGDRLKISGGEIRDANLAGTASQAAVGRGSGTGQIIEGVIIANPGARGIQSIDYVRNCTVIGNTGDAAVQSAKEINGGYYAGRIGGLSSGGAVLHCEITTEAGATYHAVDLNTATDVRVIGNRLRAHLASGKRAYSEAGVADRNLYMGNSYYGATNVVGAASVQANNIAMTA